MYFGSCYGNTTNVDLATRLLLMMASAPPQNDPLNYKPKYVTQQAHPIL